MLSILRRPAFLASFWSSVTDEEATLLEGAGTNATRFHVLVRAPWTVAIGRRAYLPGLLGGVIVFGVGYRHGVLLAAVAAAVSGIVLTATVLAHEVGHILFARGSRGVKPRMLVLFSGGGFTIVEGRHENPRGAALFAVGGPLASLAIIVPLVAGGILLPTGPFATALLVPAVLATVLALINLLPVAPMDGWLLLRSAEWAKHGSREEADTAGVAMEQMPARLLDARREPDRRHRPARRNDRRVALCNLRLPASQAGDPSGRGVARRPPATRSPP